MEYLMAFWLFDPMVWLIIFMVVFGLGLLIFIHELGHFLVAKACGVKCEKFYVGFDVPIAIPLGIPFTKLRFGTLRLPSSLWKKQWGETEYGVGILPLGGYVKMLGQDDNPYNQQDEFERAKAEGEAADDEPTRPDQIAAGQASDPQWDERSYMAKSVPQRMAIISAGVIMNAILAFVLASIAYLPSLNGVQYEASIIGRVSPGGVAWYNNWHVGDEMVEFNGIKEPRFNKDTRVGTLFGDAGQQFTVVRKVRDTEDLQHDTIQPKLGQDGRLRLGITASQSLELVKQRPAHWGTPAADAGLEGEDRIVAVKVPGVHDKPLEITKFYQLHEVLVRYPGKPIEVTVERGGEDEAASTQRLTFTVKPMPMRRLGLVMKLGKITDVQPGSPADTAGVQPGDQIVRVVDEAGQELPIDPIGLPEQLRQRAGESVSLTVNRDGKEQTIEIVLSEPRWAEEPLPPGDQPMSAPALGIAYDVLNTIAAVKPDSPAGKGGQLKAGSKISEVKFIQPEVEDFTKKSLFEKREFTVKLEGDEKVQWSLVECYYLQRCLPGTKVELTLESGESVTLTPQESKDWFRPARGFFFDRIIRKRQAASFGEALALGWGETKDSLTLVVKFIQRIGTFWKEAGGPITIVRFAAGMAEQGFPDYLVFLAMLSANLAVINILPIPVLDGGHMVFLAYEGIRGKPPSEKVLISLNFLGLAFILTLMVTVIALDIGRL